MDYWANSAPWEWTPIVLSVLTLRPEYSPNFFSKVKASIKVSDYVNPESRWFERGVEEAILSEHWPLASTGMVEGTIYPQYGITS